MTRFGLATLATILLWQTGAADTPAPVSPVPERDKLLSQMADIIASSVVRRDTTHAVFHGCYDWHSAVHGHWALLRIARVTGGHDERARIVEKSLSLEGLAREAALLREKPRFEMPYGRAWFLRLAIEFELWATDVKLGDPQRLRSMADEVARSMLDVYNVQRPSPLSREYGNASWALTQLHAYARHSDDTALRTRTDALIRQYMLEPDTAPSPKVDAANPDFFSTFGNWAYLIVKTQDAAAVAEFFRAHPLPENEIRPVRLLPRAHHLGMTWSRAWALRALSRSAGDQAARRRFDRAFLEHVQTGIQQHAAHAGSYGAYDHWVPQFAVYAITE